MSETVFAEGPEDQSHTNSAEGSCRRAYDRFEDVTRIGTPFFPLQITTVDADLMCLTMAVWYELPGQLGQENAAVQSQKAVGRGKLLLGIQNEGPEFIGETVDLILLIDEQKRLRPELVDRQETPQGLGGKRREQLTFKLEKRDLEVLAEGGKIEARLLATEVKVGEHSLAYLKALAEELSGSTATPCASSPSQETTPATSSTHDSLTSDKKAADPQAADANAGSAWEWKEVPHLTGEQRRIRAWFSYHWATVIDFASKAVLMISHGGRGGGICCTYRSPTAFEDARQAGERALREVAAGTAIFKEAGGLVVGWATRVSPVKPWGSDELPLEPPNSFIPVDELIRRRPWWNP